MTPAAAAVENMDPAGQAKGQGETITIILHDNY
jgi:hypothetical protein